MSRLCILLPVFLFFAVPVCRAAEVETAFTFEADVRPILRTHCFHCHGEAGVREGGLDVRLRRHLAEGGESGPAIDPGHPGQSRLLARLVDGEMPPEEVEHRPTEDEIAVLRQWIQQGAETAGEEPLEIDERGYITEAERTFWSFQPIRRPQLPMIEESSRLRSSIDSFIQAQLNLHDLSLSDDATRRQWIRRATLDLWGLPPTEAELQTFLRDDRPGAYERLIDRLLSDPAYGEHWARHWLDVAGYADSEGYTDTDPVRADAFRYRDYVIRSLNENKPLDQFIVEQLAGDELIGRELKNLNAQETEWLIATGFLRMAPDGTASGGVDATTARNEMVAKTIEIVSSSLLGLTVACAQCHDHRYDPISQHDYYSFRAIFDPAFNWKQWKSPQQRRVSLYTDEDRDRAAEIEQEAKRIEAERTRQQSEFIEKTLQEELAKLPTEIRDEVAAAKSTDAKKRTPEQERLLKQYPSVNVTAGSLYLYDRKAADALKKLADEAAALRATKPREDFVRATWEPNGETPPPSFLFVRGDPEQPGDPVLPRELSVLTNESTPDLSSAGTTLPSTGRRLTYAKWLTNGRHPLPARVLVNRVWQQYFGRGLVLTAGDFGRLGTEPTHPELLDWLADEFVRSGWNLKDLHRLILRSTVYRQSSSREARAEQADPDNLWYSRMALRRLPAEVLRDSVLRVSGELNRKAGGPAVPVMADRVGRFVVGKENLNAGRPGKTIELGGEPFRRSIYIEARRSRPLSVLEPFDLPAMTPNCTVRNSSTVATQSLLMMNSDFILARAKAFAARVRNDAGDDLETQIKAAWQLALGSEPDEEQQSAARQFIESISAEQPAESDPATGLQTFCHALLSSNAFLYID